MDNTSGGRQGKPRGAAPLHLEGWMKNTSHTLQVAGSQSALHSCKQVYMEAGRSPALAFEHAEFAYFTVLNHEI